MEMIETTEAFKAKVTAIQGSETYKEPVAFGICRVDFGQMNLDKVLQATYPVVNWKENFGSAAVFMEALAEAGTPADTSGAEAVCNVSLAFLESCLKAFTPYADEAYGDAHKNIQVISSLYNQVKEDGMRDGEFRVVFLFEDAPCQSVEATYLKLYAMSLGKVALRSINLNGAFGALPNVAWSDGQPIELDWLREYEIELKFSGEYPHIDFVDKFPRFLQHIIPADNTRILETSKVRFGAQLAAGTTVMPGASYVNFNAGTLGAAMVEGRISSSAIVGKNSDIGGGASMLGVLSGTDGVPISLGENSLLSANSVQGIPLGNETTLSSGVSIMDSTPITIDPKYLEKLSEKNPDINLKDAKIGKDIIGINRALIVQNENGVVIKWNNNPIKLNENLH